MLFTITGYFTLFIRQFFYRSTENLVNFFMTSLPRWTHVEVQNYFQHIVFPSENWLCIELFYNAKNIVNIKTLGFLKPF